MRDEFFIERHGKRYCLYAGLIDDAHENGLRSIDTNLIQVPTNDNGNVAVVKAVVEAEDGRSFSGIGDASPENVGRNIAPHIIRMAETRAKARALRDFGNVAVAALEELSDGEEGSTRTGSQGRAQSQEGTSPTPISQGRERRSRDDERTPGGVLIGRANELIERIIKAGHKREEVAPYIWKATPEAFEKKWREYQGKDSG